MVLITASCMISFVVSTKTGAVLGVTGFLVSVHPRLSVENWHGIIGAP
jgi:hypothetical protein